ncbi:hypothetical protein [Rhizobium sp. P44RR-XXIV]|uniref:hypothetical protein n=1 Tax=Rhizobium sp. P44RR-XXIV TaxID=1921145 RepID=UPI0009878B1B|nr:hypothetical protein [Rhizobium sp. P44RR-XXIV]TIX89181.1 hypothetical protein BSK43_021485 [Rhizobium sp. P44RR-XXIV]
MTTAIMRLGSAFPGSPIGPRVIPRNNLGVPAFGLANMFTFSETTLANGLQDSITGLLYATEGAALDATNTEEMLPGGGMRLGGWRDVFGPVYNLQNPWTVACTFQRGAPVDVANSACGILSTGSVDASGWFIWTQSLPGESVAIGGRHGVYTNRFVTPTTVTANAVVKPYAGAYGQVESIVVTHDGTGQINVFNIKGGAVAMMADTFDMTKIGGPNLPAKFGSAHSTINKGQKIYDLAAIYNRALSLAEAKAFAAAGAAIALGRGRS